MSETRDRIKIQKLEEKLVKCVQYLIVVAAETGDANIYNLLAEIEGKHTSYEVMQARAKPFLDATQKERDKGGNWATLLPKKEE